MTETTEAPTEAASALIDALAQGGEFVDQGGFRLDHARAREKLRAYNLSEPEIYTCLLVEVAVLLGAEQVAFVVDADTLEVRFGGAGFETSELEYLCEALFVEIPDEADAAERRRRRALQLLSLAIQAALGLGARALELRSPPAKRALVIDAGEGEERWTMSAEEVASDRNVVSIRFPAQTLSADFPGVEALRQRCAWSQFPIYLDNKRVSKGHDAAFLGIRGKSVALLDSAPILDEDGQTIGRGALLEATVYKTAQLHVLCNGWRVEQLSLPDSLVGFEAVVELDLRRDLAQAKLLRNDAFAAMREAVERCAKKYEGLGLETTQHDPEKYRHVEASQFGLVIGISFLVLCAIPGIFCIVLAFAGRDLDIGIFGLAFTLFGGAPLFVEKRNARAEKRQDRGLTRAHTDRLFERP
ncbi:hypothetical protein G6O69_23785 [Pseudenhygromyxa sp. WMMC2535]|uniref:hypothetical protein n=1 Tax=Pseudenhygromyxa sp. WMMC2535 TaxID=2712867 RepID=UPI00155814B4|nr:hypothetical protein [Pseudenhygromyxa sp. WMMC2535]NVB40881.1 hypothetical protein [Pseudenhygromyxa sp. WMMC2535]